MADRSCFRIFWLPFTTAMVPEAGPAVWLEVAPAALPEGVAVSYSRLPLPRYSRLPCWCRYYLEPTVFSNVTDDNVSSALVSLLAQLVRMRICRLMPFVGHTLC